MDVKFETTQYKNMNRTEVHAYIDDFVLQSRGPIKNILQHFVSEIVKKIALAHYVDIENIITNYITSDECRESIKQMIREEIQKRIEKEVDSMFEKE